MTLHQRGSVTRILSEVFLKSVINIYCSSTHFQHRLMGDFSLIIKDIKSLFFKEKPWNLFSCGILVLLALPMKN